MNTHWNVLLSASVLHLSLKRNKHGSYFLHMRFIFHTHLLTIALQSGGGEISERVHLHRDQGHNGLFTSFMGHVYGPHWCTKLVVTDVYWVFLPSESEVKSLATSQHKFKCSPSTSMKYFFLLGKFEQVSNCGSPFSFKNLSKPSSAQFCINTIKDRLKSKDRAHKIVR